MPTYTYKCSKCDRIFEVKHLMSELDTPRSFECDGESPCQNTQGETVELQRIPSLPALGRFTMMSQTERTQSLKKRASDHYKKEVKEDKFDKWKKTFKKDYK